MVTQEDIAKKLGITRTTVARALKGMPSVKEKTRRLVCEEAERMGYVPNGAATSLALKKEKHIYAFIVATIDEEYGRQMSEGITNVSNTWSGYQFNIHIIYTDISKGKFQCDVQLAQFETILQNNQVDGVIFSALCRRNRDVVSETCVSRDIPLMTVDSIYPDSSLCHVGPDYFVLGTYSAAFIANLMMGQGRILTLSYDEGYELGKKRMEGFHHKLKEYEGIECYNVDLDVMSVERYLEILEEEVPKFNPVAIYSPYHVDFVGQFLNQNNLQHKIITISNGVNQEVENYLFDGTINGIVSARPYYLGTVVANNFFKYFYRFSEVSTGIIDVACDIYIRENYKRFDRIY